MSQYNLFENIVWTDQDPHKMFVSYPHENIRPEGRLWHVVCRQPLKTRRTCRGLGRIFANLISLCWCFPHFHRTNCFEYIVRGLTVYC